MDEAKPDPTIPERTLAQAWPNKISAGIKELEQEKTDLLASLEKVNYALNRLCEILKELE